MKKRLMMIAVLSMALALLPGCSNADKGNGSAEPEKKTGTEQVKEGASPKTEKAEVIEKVDITEVLENSFKAGNEIKTFSANMTNYMKFTGPDGEEDDMNMDMEMTYQLDPLFMHIKSKSKMKSMGDTYTDMEVFMDKDYVYALAPGSQDQWSKMKMGESFITPDQFKDQFNTEKYLDYIKSDLKSYSVEETEEGYLIKYSGDPSKLMEMIFKDLGTEGEEGKELMENLKVNSMKYEYVITKDTYMPLRINTSYNYDIADGADGKMTNFDQTAEIVYTMFNEAVDVTIPEAALSAPVIEP